MKQATRWGSPAIRGGVVTVACMVLAGMTAAPLAEAAQSNAVPGTTVMHGDTVPKVAHLGPKSFSKPGPLGVGETTLLLPTDRAPVEVWYPATKKSVAGKPVATYDVATWLPAAFQKLIPAGSSVTYPSGGVRGVPVAPGRYPLVVFSHGYAGFRDQSTFLTARLASWGFVVAAPDHFSRDLTEVLGGHTATGATKKTTDVADLKATIALMKAQNASGTSPLHRHIDLGRIGAVGHSAGGAAAEALAATDPQVTTFIGLAGATVGAFGQSTSGADSIVPHQPGLLMSGTSDHVVSDTSMIKAYGKLHAPKRLILLRGAGHLVFSDLCEIGSSQGGLLSIAAVLHVPIPASLVPLASDGCSAPDLAPPLAWPVIRQAVTAQLRHAFAFDPSTAGLKGLATAYPKVVAKVHASPGRQR
ncbi:MAG TPA: dienelactone hydrolase family protein [Acidimicrobiales bacterium]|nr:dienelactone hydrolase family protein [Acidimicrobiales bacterium]